MTTNTMVDDMAECLARARKLGHELGSAADSLNVEIEAVEKELARLRLGVAASTELTAGEQCDEEQWLAFKKYGDVWRLIVEQGRPGDDESWRVTPLVSTSRDTRKQAFAMLPRLLEALIGNAERELTELSAAVNLGASFSAALRRDSPVKRLVLRRPKKAIIEGED